MRKFSLLFLMLITVLAVTGSGAWGQEAAKPTAPAPAVAPATPQTAPPTVAPPAAAEAAKPVATEAVKPAAPAPAAPQKPPKTSWKRPSPKPRWAPARGKSIPTPPRGLWASPALPATSGSGTSSGGPGWAGSSPRWAPSAALWLASAISRSSDCRIMPRALNKPALL